MNLKSSGITARYAVVQAMYWMSFCMVFSYSSVYLLDKGFTNTEIGLLIGIAGTISAILQPLVGGMADRGKRITLRIWIILIGGLMLLMAASLLVIPNNPILISGFFCGLIVFLQVLTPLVYSLGMVCVNQGKSLNFGLARGIGSLSFAGISYVAGILVAATSTIVIPALIAGIYGLFMVAVFCFRYDGMKDRKEDYDVIETSTVQEDKTPFFARYHRFFALLVGAILVFTSHNMINNFAFQIMASKGGGSEAMGTVMALAAVSELPTMFVFSWMVKKAKSGTWLKVSGVFFSIKAVATLLVGSIGGMYLIQGLQMFGFALFVVASVYYVNSIMEEKDRVKGQAYMTMTNTLGSVLGSLLGGILIDLFEIPSMLFVSAVAAVTGMIIMAISTGKK